MNSLEDFILRQMDKDDDITKLSMGDPTYIPLKIFLRKNALDFHSYEIAKTYVLINKNLELHRIWAYITLMNSEIVVNQGQRPQEVFSLSRYDAFPAVKIARLAVDKNLQGNGFGSMLLDWCMNHIKSAIMPYCGCRFLVVDAKRDSILFYQKRGFTLLNTTSNNNDQHPLMFFDMYKENKNISQIFHSNQNKEIKHYETII